MRRAETRRKYLRTRWIARTVFALLIITAFGWMLLNVFTGNLKKIGFFVKLTSVYWWDYALGVTGGVELSVLLFAWRRLKKLRVELGNNKTVEQV